MAGRFDELMHVFLLFLLLLKILCSFVFFYQMAMYENIICIIGKKLNDSMCILEVNPGFSFFTNSQFT